MTDSTDKQPIVRHPSDLQRLLLALLVGVGGFLLATYLNTISEAITVEVVNGIGTFPGPVIIAVVIGIDVLTVFVPVGVVAALMWQRRWRTLLLAIVAGVSAQILTFFVENEVVSRFSAGDLPFTPPEWVCSEGTALPSWECIPAATGSSALVYAAGFAATFAVLYPQLSARWRRFGWAFAAVLVIVRMVESFVPPTGELLAVALGFIVGTAVLLIFGTPDRKPDNAQISESLSRSGWDLAAIKRAAVDARGSSPYFATASDGTDLFVKVLTPEERAADNMFRVTRMFRLKGVGDERPFSSLKRAVEHEAVASLKAASDGITTPRLEAVADIVPNSMVMAYRMIDGSSLDGVDDDQITDGVLAGIWEQVKLLRVRRTAHRDLRLANVFLADDGTPWIIDFGFAELAATDGQLKTDVAELTMSTALKVGPERAVANAVGVLGPDVVADAASRIQPLALSGATREGLKKQKGLDAKVREEIETQTGRVPDPVEDIERVKATTVLMVVGFALAIYLLIPQLAQTDFGAVLDADWRWAPVILLASFFTYVGAAWNVMGSVPQRLPLVSSVLAQFAGTFINRITPVKIGGMATNVRFLQKNGVDTSVAVAGVGVSSVGTFIVHMSLLIMSVVFIGRNASDFIKLPSGNAVLVGLVIVFTLAGAVWFLPVGRKLFKTKVWPILKRSGQGIAQVATSPKNALMLFGGAFLMIMSYITALWFSLEAFGGGLSYVGIALVFLAGQALGQAAPTPGGIGATEAAMIAAMTALGLDASVAVPTVFLYRIATFWLPILPGFFSLKKLEADGAL
jgi:uncharacterized protein (TIRG00374 family)